tara:strand:+ start:30962 stop:31441 length:480 start_codon:yes stop_codon:yes gene_type:complete
MNKNRLEHLLKKHHQNAFMWASQCCHYNIEEGKEVLQMAYFKIAEGKAVYNEKSTFKTWLFSVIRFTALDHLKKQQSFEGIEKLYIMTEEQKETDAIDYKKLLFQLSDRQHQVLLLSFYHGMTLSEIAEVAELHIGTVRTHYERGKEALKTLILKKKDE